jgi:long-chain fatty acid transport protein
LPENYRDTWTIGAGADYQTSEAFTLRGGVRFDRTPTVDGYRDTAFPDENRFWLTVGGSYRISDASSVDFAIAHAFIRQASIDLTRTFFAATPLATSVRINGEVDGSFTLVGVSFNYAY